MEYKGTHNLEHADADRSDDDPLEPTAKVPRASETWKKARKTQRQDRGCKENINRFAHDIHADCHDSDGRE